MLARNAAALSRLLVEYGERNVRSKMSGIIIAMECLNAIWRPRWGACKNSDIE